MYTPKPIYKHDCDDCVFLGQSLSVINPQLGPHDLYICPKSMIGGGSVVARYSDEGQDYTSCMISVIKTMPMVGGLILKEGLRRAKVQGLLPSPKKDS